METFEKLQEEAQEKIRLRKDTRLHELRVEKERKRRQSLEKLQKEEEEKIGLRTEKRLAELSLESIRKDRRG
jgi:hypothetical protein